MINGVTLPGFSIVFGSLFDVFFNAGMDPDVRSWEISKMGTFFPLRFSEKKKLATHLSIPPSAIIFVGIGLGTFLMTYLSNTLWIIVAERVGKKLRLRFITAVLNQDAAFYDKTQSGVLVSRLSADVILIQSMFSVSTIGVWVNPDISPTAGIEKLSNAIYNASQVLAGVIVAFIYGWKMTLVMLAMSPLMVLSGFLESSIISGKAKDAQHANAKANDIASEAFSGFKTVYSFVSERRMINKYKNNLKKAYGIGIKRAHFTGSGSGFVYLFMFAVYGYVIEE
jgi:ATP-binding cassette subfamily B (MDR/TAP) protein 1